jgi:hypothetical protein
MEHARAMNIVVVDGFVARTWLPDYGGPRATTALGIAVTSKGFGKLISV